MAAASRIEQARQAGTPFARGAWAMLSMWIAVLPIASAYALTARQAGFSLPETQLMSAVIFSAPVQINLVNLLASGAPAMTILGTSIVLMLQATFYGVSLRQRIPHRKF